MPVLVATCASVPIITSTGQKIEPGPIPQNAAPNAPKNEIKESVVTFLVVASRSPGENS